MQHRCMRLERQGEIPKGDPVPPWETPRRRSTGAKVCREIKASVIGAAQRSPLHKGRRWEGRPRSLPSGKTYKAKGRATTTAARSPRCASSESGRLNPRSNRYNAKYLLGAVAVSGGGRAVRLRVPRAAAAPRGRGPVSALDGARPGRHAPPGGERGSLSLATSRRARRGPPACSGTVTAPGRHRRRASSTSRCTTRSSASTVYASTSSSESRCTCAANSRTSTSSSAACCFPRRRTPSLARRASRRAPARRPSPSAPRRSAARALRTCRPAHGWRARRRPEAPCRCRRRSRPLAIR